MIFDKIAFLLISDFLKFEIAKGFKFSLIKFYTLGHINLMLNIPVEQKDGQRDKDSE